MRTSLFFQAAFSAGLLLLGGCGGGIISEPTFTPIAKNRFFVQGWAQGSRQPPEGWAYTKPMTITELRDFCKSQVCYVWGHYIKAGSNTISAELDKPSDLARILQIHESGVRPNYDVYVLDLRYEEVEKKT